MSATFTPQLDLALPATGDLDWGPEVDGNFSTLDAAVYANREDRWIKIFGGGTLLYSASAGTLSFTQDIVIFHGITAFTSTIPTSQSPMHVSTALRLVYCNITRDPQANELLTVINSNLFYDQTQVPSTNNSFIFALRDDSTPTNNLILFNDQVLIDGEPSSLGVSAAPSSLPGQLLATTPASSRLQVLSSPYQRLDGTSAVVPIVDGLVPSFPNSTVDFQSQSTTGATFNVTWPALGVVGYYYLAGFSVQQDGSISINFSPASVSQVGLANPGTLFTEGDPLGWVVLLCTNTSPAYFQTADSATHIIENEVDQVSQIFIFESGSGNENPPVWVQEGSPAIGVVNGSNATYTLSQTPISSASLMVYTDDGYLPPTQWSLTGSTLTLDSAPPLGYSVDVSYPTHIYEIGGGSGSGNGRWTIYGSLGSPIIPNSSISLPVTSDDRQCQYVASSGGPQVMGGTPQIADGINDGQELLLKGVSDTNYIILEDNVNLSLNGTWYGTSNAALTLIWHVTDGIWSEDTRR